MPPDFISRHLEKVLFCFKQNATVLPESELPRHDCELDTVFVPDLNQALSRSAFLTTSITTSVLIQTCPCPNETCTMSGQNLK